MAAYEIPSHSETCGRHSGQRPDNIGYLAAKAFACQGTVVAMLHEAGEESCHIVDCLPGSSHLVMSGRLNHSSDLASFAGLVHTLYGRVDYLIICEDASVEVQGLSCSSRVRLSVLLEHAFVSGAMIVNRFPVLEKREYGRKIPRAWKIA